MLLCPTVQSIYKKYMNVVYTSTLRYKHDVKTDKKISNSTNRNYQQNKHLFENVQATILNKCFEELNLHILV